MLQLGPWKIAWTRLPSYWHLQLDVFWGKTISEIFGASTNFYSAVSKNCTIPTVASFMSVQRDRSTFLFICSTSSTWTTDVQNILEKPEPRPKQKHRRPEPRKHGIPPLVFSTRIFFGTMRHFLKFFVFHQMSAFVCFDILQHNGCQKITKRPPFYHFRLCDTVQNFHFPIFSWVFQNLPKAPFDFFHVLQQTGVSQSPLLQFWA